MVSRRLFSEKNFKVFFSSSWKYWEISIEKKNENMSKRLPLEIHMFIIVEYYFMKCLGFSVRMWFDTRDVSL